MIQDNITGFVLAGGKSSRMKQDKSMMMLRDKTMIEHVIEHMKDCVDDLCIISNNDEHTKFGYPIYADEVKDIGPLGGIYTALKHTRTESNLILACDTPFINTEILQVLISKKANDKIVVLKTTHGIQPLCAIYPRGCIHHVEQLIHSNTFKLQEVLKAMDYLEINIEYIEKKYDNVFMNINTLDDFKFAAKHFATTHDDNN